MNVPVDKPVPTEPEHVQCEVCLTDIPLSVAVTPEGKDYIHHFCGLECMGRWKGTHSDAKKE